MLGAAVGDVLEREARDRECAAADPRPPDTARSRSRQNAVACRAARCPDRSCLRSRAISAVRLRRALERLQPHQRQHALDQARPDRSRRAPGWAAVRRRRRRCRARRPAGRESARPRPAPSAAPRPRAAQALADHDAVDVAGVEIARRGLDAEARRSGRRARRSRPRAPGRSGRARRTARWRRRAGRSGGGPVRRDLGLGAARAPQHGRVQGPHPQRRAQPRQQPARPARRAAIGSAWGSASIAVRRRTRASTGMTGPPRVSIFLSSASDRPRARRRIAAPRAAARPAGFRRWPPAHRPKPVSTIGKAPALPSTSSKSAADLSATTTIGPRSAMTIRRLQGAEPQP